MATTQNTYTGNGTNKLFSITFPYLDTSDINVYLNGVLQTITTQYTFANATTVEFVTAPANGAVVLLDRSTDDTALQATFFPGSSIKASDLNDNFDQVLYLAQETANSAANQSTAGLQAQITAANNTSNTALTTANAANTTANGIASTANTALSNSSAAVTTANAASATATAASATANAALPLTGGTLTGNLTVPSLNGGPLAGFRNAIINGDMRISQRGTSFATLPTGSTYTLDRWLYGAQGAMVCTVSQDTDVPNNTFLNSIKVDVTTADTSIAASDFTTIVQIVEGYNVRALIGTSFTLSFWVKSPKTGTHCVAFRNLGAGSPPGPDRSFVKEYTVTAANTWEYKTITVTGGLITAGTWDWTNGRGLIVDFALVSGTTFQTTADAWQTGNFIATANQVNVMDNTANDFFLTGVQLEPGTVATPFERRSFGQELALCQRYYSTRPNVYLLGYGLNATGFATHVSFPVEMRATPVVTLSNLVYVNASAGTTNNVSSGGFALNATASSTASASVNATFVANAEL